jgi:hypothetical protein
MMRAKLRLFFTFLSIFLLLAACGPASPAQDAESVLETMVAATVRALPSTTPIPASPTATATIYLTATRATPTDWPTETPFPTFTQFVMPTPLASFTPQKEYSPPKINLKNRQGNDQYACVVAGQSPGNSFIASPGQTFSVGWIIYNAGSEGWDNNSIDVVLRTGEDIALAGNRIDIGSTVPSGVTSTVKITVKAPNKPGEYQTKWALARGDQFFCRFSFSFVVR